MIYLIDDTKINGQGSFPVAGELHLSYKGEELRGTNLLSR